MLSKVKKLVDHPKSNHLFPALTFRNCIRLMKIHNFE